MKFIALGYLLLIFVQCKTDGTNLVKTATSRAPEEISATQMAIENAADASSFPFSVTLKDNKKKDVSSHQILPSENKPTVMMFWLTTCAPCSRELQAIKNNFEQWQVSVPFHLVAISEDREENYPAFVDRIANELWPFNAYWDYSRSFKSLMPGNLNGLPQTFIFDKNGKLSWSKRGFLPGDELTILEKIKEAARS